MLVTIVKDDIESICRKTFLDGNGNNTYLQEWDTVAKGQIMEILKTCTEFWWKDLIGHTGRNTRNNKAAGVIDLSFIVKPIVIYINEVVKAFSYSSRGQRKR